MTMIEAFKQAIIEEGIPADVIDDLMRKCPIDIPEREKNRVLTEIEKPLVIARFKGMASAMMFMAEKIYGQKYNRN